MFKLLKAIGDDFPHCLTIVDINAPGRPCIYVNEHFTKNTGYSSEEAVGRNLSFLQGELTAEDTQVFMRNSFKEKLACIQDIINYKKDGTPFLNRLLMLPFSDGDRELYIGFQNDITSTKGLEYNNESLKKVNDGEIRHMVNNPLTIILSTYYILLKENESIDEDKYNKVKESLANNFARIIDYSLNIEDVSNFENYDFTLPDAKVA